MKLKNSLFSIAFILFALILNAQEISKWEKLPLSGPMARSSHIMENANDIVYLFGGDGGSSVGLLNDMYTFTEEEGWNEIFPSNMPPARSFHASCTINDKIYILGGVGNSGMLMDIWEFDPESNNWSQLESSMPFSSRSYYHATKGDGKIWISGGMLGADYSTLGEIWSYDISNGEWEQGETCPSPRYGHASFFTNNKLYVTMGRQNDDLLNDMWSYDVITEEWNLIEYGKTIPPGLKFMAQVIYYFNNTIMVWIAGGTILDLNGYFVDSGWNATFNSIAISWAENTYGPLMSFLVAAALNNLNNKDDNMKALVFGGTRDGIPVDETWIYSANSNWNLVSIENEDELKKPVNSYFSNGQIFTESQENITKILIYNTNGQLLNEECMNSKNWQSNAETYVPGIYFVQIHSNHQIINKKILIPN